MRYYINIILFFSIILGGINKMSSQDIIYFNKRECFESFSRENHSEGIISTDSGYIVAGISVGSNSGYDVINIGYFNLNGNKITVKSYLGNDEFNYYLGYSGCLINNHSNNLLICGYCIDTIPQSYGLLLLMDQNMDTLWTRRFAETNQGLIRHYYFYQIKETSDSNYIIIGMKHIPGDHTDVLLVKTDPNGNLLWEETYGQGGSYYEWGYSVCETEDFGFIIGARKLQLTVHESPDPIILKVDSLGNLQWQKNVGGPYRDGKALVVKSQNNQYIIGTTIADSMATPYDAYRKINIMKMDSGGNIIWSQKYGPSTRENMLTSIKVNEDGSIISCGQQIFAPYGYFGWFLKANRNGDSIWMRYYDHLSYVGSYHFLNDFKPASDGGYVACGDLLPIPPDTGNRDIWLLKVDSIGCDTPGCDTTVFIRNLLLKEDNPCVIYPNPVTDCSTLEYLGIPSEEALLSVYDCQGRLLLYRKYKPYEKIIISNNQFKPGIYFFRLHIGKSWHSGKFVVL